MNDLADRSQITTECMTCMEVQKVTGQIKDCSKCSLNQKGFTLIELLIVIVILGVLAAALIPNLSKFVGQGQLGAANAELASVRTAVSANIAGTGGVIPSGAYTATTILPTVGSYVTGTIIGDYTVGADGSITGTNAHRTGINWDSVNQAWVK